MNIFPSSLILPETLIAFFVVVSAFMLSCFIWSVCIVSCFVVSPDCARAATDTAREHIAINLQIIFLRESS
jgi:hypothetical protein